MRLGANPGAATGIRQRVTVHPLGIARIQTERCSGHIAVTKPPNHRITDNFVGYPSSARENLYLVFWTLVPVPQQSLAFQSLFFVSVVQDQRRFVFQRLAIQSVGDATESIFDESPLQSWLAAPCLTSQHGFSARHRDAPLVDDRLARDSLRHFSHLVEAARSPAPIDARVPFNECFPDYAAVFFCFHFLLFPHFYSFGFPNAASTAFNS